MRTPSHIVLFAAALCLTPLLPGTQAPAFAASGPTVASGEWDDLEGFLLPICVVLGCCEAQSPDAMSADSISAEAAVQRVVDAYYANGVSANATWLQRQLALASTSSSLLWLTLHPNQLSERLEADFRKVLVKLKADL